MTDLLAAAYPWTKALHIMAVIAWMAGLFYLPRLFVYHVETVGETGDTHGLFMTMERRLIRVIMNPAMIATWVFGLCLLFTPGLVSWDMIWPWTKGAGVLAMTWFHHWCSMRRKELERGENHITGRQFRMMNEVPTLLMVLIVVSVVVRF
ncbi:CopD family protein [Sulfitobacter sp. D35]|uniref:CopD family protein n=1 Tax=Sulfitobacter sp. D35 TaxID=3083252 RepID=UPI00296E3416|nr:CopD family protein [Sulfitobacter sp. D35]MDW4498075.1 CopD family protein [Sulfitobacter sp. D35]